MKTQLFVFTIFSLCSSIATASWNEFLQCETTPSAITFSRANRMLGAAPQNLRKNNNIYMGDIHPYKIDAFAAGRICTSPPSGKLVSGITQWMTFDFKATNYFGTPVAGHIPVFLRFSDGGPSNPSPTGLGLAIESDGTVSFEHRYDANPKLVKLEDVLVAQGKEKKAVVLQNGRQYSIAVHVQSGAVAAWIYDKTDGKTVTVAEVGYAVENKPIIANATGFVFANICAPQLKNQVATCNYQPPVGLYAGTQAYGWNYKLEFTNIGIGWF